MSVSADTPSMLDNQTLVETPYAVARLEDVYVAEDGRMVGRVTRIQDETEHHFDMSCLVRHRVWNLGDTVRVLDVRANDMVCDGYGEIIQRSRCGHRRYAYEVRMEDGSERWANAFTIQDLSEIVPDVLY